MASVFEFIKLVREGFYFYYLAPVMLNSSVSIRKVSYEVLMGAALYSIKKKYADLILSGLKTVEFRKCRPGKKLEKIIIYESRGSGRIVGEALVDDVINCSVSHAWQIAGERGRISKEEFDSYYSGHTSVTLIVLCSPLRFTRPISLCEIGLARAPQSFCYLSDLQCSRIDDLSRCSELMG